ncbi:MAG TPA: hypothetical protein VIC58_12200 [Actinomycetota bacterium]|jgi:hypothetical protein
MPYLIVFVLAAIVGGGVYLATVNRARATPALGFGGPEPVGEEPGNPGPGYAYLRLSTRGPSWQDRVVGILGLIVLIVLGTAALAFAIYQAGFYINRTIEAFLD